MKNFNKFWTSSLKVFWAVNIGFAILSAMIVGFIFKLEQREIWIQMGITVTMLFPLIWMIGGYTKLKSTNSSSKNPDTK